MSLGIASGARAPLAPGAAAAYNDDVEVVQKFDITRIFPKQARSVLAGCILVAVLALAIILGLHASARLHL